MGGCVRFICGCVLVSNAVMRNSGSTPRFFTCRHRRVTGTRRVALRHLCAPVSTGLVIRGSGSPGCGPRLEPAANS